MIFGSCHFLFHKRIQRDEAYEIVADVDALMAVAAAFIRRAEASMFLATIWPSPLKCTVSFFIMITPLCDLIYSSFPM